MNRRGFTLIEILVAVALVAIAMPLLYLTFYQGIRYSDKVRAEFEKRRLTVRPFSAMEKDLKNAVLFSLTPFNGINNRLSFASLGADIRKISYELKDGM